MKQKGLRKLVSMILAVVMVLAMSITGFAASINIQDANVGETYTAYQIFTATQSGESNITYYISSSSAYYGDIAAMSNLASDTQQGENSYSQLFTLVATGTTGSYQVTWETTNEDDIITYLTSLGGKGTAAGNVTVTTTKDEETGEETTNAEISGLDAGYYYVTTTTGSVVSIGTAGTTEIKEKNGTPTPNKTVSNTENGEGSETNTASIGDTVYYKVVIEDADQITDLVMTDTLSPGLTLNEDVKVTVGSVSVNQSDGSYSVNYGNYSGTNGTKLTITFVDDYLKALASNAEITVTYSAVINANAVIGDEGNGNSVTLSYGNEQSTTDTTTTYVYDFNLDKTDGTNQLTGASFTLANSEGTLISFVSVDDEYRVATSDETAGSTTISAGSVNIKGLSAGTYTLTETAAPAGYNQLTSSITIVIGEDGTVSLGDGSNENGSIAETTGRVTVVNKSGTELPSTGGMGTTIFYIVGGVLVLGAAVLFVTKKRLGSEN